jgi:predicted Abi (CAAX) family protease
VQNWLTEHPDDPQTLLFQDLVSLGQRLQGQLVPLGIARPDWQENASVLAGTEEEEIESQRVLDNETNLVNNLLSWRTVIPRVAHDNIATQFCSSMAGKCGSFVQIKSAEQIRLSCPWPLLSYLGTTWSFRWPFPD